MFYKEIWKEYPLKFGNTNDYRLEISNYGRVKSYNQRTPEGRILNGTLQSGYPIIRLKLIKPRTPAVISNLEQFEEELKLIREEIAAAKKSKLPPLEKIQKVQHLTDERKKTVTKRSKYIKKTDLKRTINFHLLIHRAVAELFLEKPDGADTVIHKDFSKTNNHADNLQWVSKDTAYSRYSEMPVYKLKKLRANLLGEESPKRGTSKLQERDILYIKEKLSQGKTLRELATKFSVSDMQIHRIKTGQNWSEVKTVKEMQAEYKK